MSLSGGLSTILPANENPYLALNGAYKSQLILKHPNSANPQLYFLSIVHAITIFVLIAALFINWWKARFWFIRRHAPSPLLVLNFSVVGSIVGIVLISFFEVALARSIQTFEGWLQKDWGFWLLFAGSTRHVAGEVVIWALAASTILRYQVKGPQLKVWAYVCNTIGVVTPIATIATSLTLSVLGGIAYSNAVGTYDKLNAFFIEESLTWSSTNLTNHFVPPPNDLVQDFEANLGKIKRWWRVSFLFQGIVGATLTVALVVVAVMYLFSLRKSIVKLGQTLGTDSLVGREGSRQHLKTTWTMLAIVLSTVILVSACAFALDLYIYLRPFSFRSPTTAIALLFVPYYLSSIPVLICAIALLYSAAIAHSSSKDAEKSWKTIFVRKWMMSRRKEVARFSSGNGNHQKLESVVSLPETTEADDVQAAVVVVEEDRVNAGADETGDDAESEKPKEETKAGDILGESDAEKPEIEVVAP